MTAVLDVKNLHKDFGGIKAVDGCNFTIERGSLTALIGPNGAGKTTVFNLITGFLTPDRGDVLLEGEEITRLPPYQRARKGIARTFQLIRLFPHMTVMENLLLAMKHQRERLVPALLQTRSTKRLEQYHEKRALELLEFVHLHLHANELARHLSYGQQKLLELARALAQEPEIILLDEPAAGVNPTMIQKLRTLLLKLKAQGTTILFIEHDMEFVMNLADNIIVMDYGREIAIGKPHDVQKNQKVIDAYLGAQ